MTEPCGPGHREKIIFLMGAGAISIMLLAIGALQLQEFSDSVSFCGRLCHQVMYPEYTAYQASPHSRVACSDCHVGPGANYLIKSKISGIPLIFSTLTNSYDRPILTPVHSLRPARDTCQQCHRPELFSGDVVRTSTTYLTDEANTAQVDTRILRIGGGPEGSAGGIHWHIAAQVYYLPLDAQRQQIGWVGVEGANGYTSQWFDPLKASEITPGRIQAERRLMDCIDCHNRATHIYRSPSELVDNAFTEGRIDARLPFIKKKITDALYPVNNSLDEANAKLDSIAGYYQSTYPQVYAVKRNSINAAIVAAKDIARLTTFPDMRVTWETYPTNAGHETAPGCFRCHGKLIAGGAPASTQTIETRCDLCHYAVNTPLPQK